MQSPHAEKASLPTARRRGGRPSAEQAGEVDRRILDAATALFLERGYDATSCDQVAVQAGAGKASLYARFANKEALFAAVVRRMVDRTLMPIADVPWDKPLHHRLRALGHAMVTHVLVPEAIALMRVVMTTAHRMPELARLMDRIGHEGGVRCAAQAIAGEGASIEEVEKASGLADTFIEMVLMPSQMRALFGDDRQAILDAAGRRIDDVIALLDADGRLEGWQ